jgi:hypothetical protein
MPTPENTPEWRAGYIAGQKDRLREFASVRVKVVDGQRNTLSTSLGNVETLRTKCMVFENAVGTFTVETGYCMRDILQVIKHPRANEKGTFVNKRF